MKKESIFVLFVFICVYVVTFPSLSPDIMTGLDGSYQWALNHLLLTDYKFLTNIVYPVGPLAFLKMPTIEEGLFWWSLLFYTILKFLFYYQFYSLSKIFDCNKLVSFLLLLITSYFISIDLLIIFNIIFLALKYYKLKKTYLIYIAVFLATLAISIKTSLGIISFSVLLSLFFIEIRSFFKLIKVIFGSLMVFLFTGGLIFLSPIKFIQYVLNTFKLSSGYTEALALFPLNNWVLLTLTLLPFYVLLINKKDVRVLLFISLPSLFATWKHSMVREDIYHVRQFFWFIIIFWVASILISKTKKYLVLLLGLVSVYSFYLNFNNLPLYTKYPFHFNGVSNFNNTILNSSEFEEGMNNISSVNLKKNILPDTILNIIEGKTIDFYPWDLTYAGANDNLNWKPRAVLQSASCYNHWLDDISSVFFDFDNGADYVLVNLYLNDLTDLNSIDDRYILNDEPISLSTIFKNYEIVYKNSKYFLLKKKRNSSESIPQYVEAKNFTINQWNKIPTELIAKKIKLLFNYQFFAQYKLRSFLFKGTPFFIDYKLHDGRVYSFRFTPNSSVDGLWLSPFIESVNNNLYQDVKEFKIRVEDDVLQSYGASFSISEFDILPTNEKLQVNVSYKVLDSTSIIAPKGFSKPLIYQYKIDSNIHKLSLIDISLNYRFSKLWQKNTSLVLDVKDSLGVSQYWKNFQLNTSRKLNLFSTKHVMIDAEDFLEMIPKNGEIRVYLWNNSNDEILIENFIVQFKNKENSN